MGPLAIVMGLPQQAADTAAQGAHLARADLGTSVVTELTSLAGVVGRHYALQSGQCTIKAACGCLRNK